MGKFTFDDDVETKAEGQDLLDAGSYLVKITEADHVELGGKDAWKITAEVLEGPSEGRNLRDTIFFTQKAQVRAYLFLTAIGIDIKEFDTDDSEECLGRKAIVEVGHEEYDDKEAKKRKKNVITFRGWKAFGTIDTPSEEESSEAKRFGEAPAGGKLPF